MENTDNIEAAKMNIAAKPKSKSELLKALELDFATTVNRAFINSLGKEVSLREVKVSEQKTLSRIMINNSLRKDIIYDTQCALINSVVLEDGFDIYDLSEFDKIKLLMLIYQASVLKKDVMFTCKHCGFDNNYKIDYRQTIERLDKLDVSDKKFNYECSGKKFTFTVSYPSVRRVSAFYREYQRAHKLTKDLQEQQETNMNFEYVNLFIKDILIEDASGKSQEINLLDYGPLDVEDIIAVFPYEVVYNDDGILRYITTQFIGKINEQFDTYECMNCHEKFEGGVETAKDFL